MPSTRGAYPQVISRLFASFRIAEYAICAGRALLCAGFDSRQLHKKGRRDAAFFVGLGGRVDCWVCTALKGAPGFIDV
jgi:hypothetical protein